jgi:hypothetical protein
MGVQVQVLFPALKQHKDLRQIDASHFSLLEHDWGQRCRCVGLVSLVLSTTDGENHDMASLEQRGNTYRVVFRHGRRKFNRSLRTKDRKAADACLARLEDNLRRMELGILELPVGADIATFLLSDGRVQRQPTPSSRFRTLADLLDGYLSGISPGSVEDTTLALVFACAGRQAAPEARPGATQFSADRPIFLSRHQQKDGIAPAVYVQLAGLKERLEE